MGTCNARSWNTGQENKVERLLTFVSEEDRTAYIERYRSFDVTTVPIDNAQRTALMRRIHVSIEHVLILADPATGGFTEHR